MICETNLEKSNESLELNLLFLEDVALEAHETEKSLDETPKIWHTRDINPLIYFLLRQLA